MASKSRALSWLLRHSGMTTRSDGYVPVRAVLDSDTMRKHRVTFRELQQIVSTNDKQRFEMEEEESPPFGTCYRLIQEMVIAIAKSSCDDVDGRVDHGLRLLKSTRFS
jgi:hypothetical protein